MNTRNENRESEQPDILNEAAVAYRTSASEPEVIYPLRTKEDQGWRDFREQCRRQMQRPIEARIKYGFSLKPKTERAGLRVRAFNTMADYRAWCEQNLPAYLGYKRPAK